MYESDNGSEEDFRVIEAIEVDDISMPAVIKVKNRKIKLNGTIVSSVCRV